MVVTRQRQCGFLALGKSNEKGRPKPDIEHSATNPSQRRESAEGHPIRGSDLMVERRGHLSQYCFSAAVKVLKLATGHEVGELSRTSQCM